jgi:hypothetical protein
MLPLQTMETFSDDETLLNSITNDNKAIVYLEKDNQLCNDGFSFAEYASINP